MMNSQALSAVPELRFSWKVSTGLKCAVSSSSRLYGIDPAGSIQAFDSGNGSKVWTSTDRYIPGYLARQGTRLFAFKLNEGLSYIDDRGETAAETLVISFGVGPATNVAAPIIDGRLVFLILNQGLAAVHQDQGLKYGTVLDSKSPHGLGLVGNGSLVVVNGRGVPTRYQAGAEAFELVWAGADHGINTELGEKPFVVAGNRVVIGIGNDTVAYDLTTGRLAWRLSNAPMGSFVADGSMVYGAFHGGSLWAIRAVDGAVLWHRQYIHDATIQGEHSLIGLGDYLYFGGPLLLNPDGETLLAVRKTDGAFAWMSRAVEGTWAGGKPLTDGTNVFVYGMNYAGAYRPIPGAPAVRQENIEIVPRPVQGRFQDFGTGEISVTLPVPARVSIALFREREGVAPSLVNGVNWSAGNHQVAWSVGGATGFQDDSQFGYLLVDIEENSGAKYTQSSIIPVNTFPDILGHWAQTYIETMVFHRFVSGYPDQLFRPDGLVTRAESCTIIAKTIGALAPNPGFKTKLTDISSHWARSYIMALEERGIVGGFAEPDGTFTFRPHLNMNRGEEARVLVRAYSIDPAPQRFVSKFRDIAGHWAEADIRALESAGYVNGFLEVDGSYTYRPGQNLTRAEMSTIIVRIRDLFR